MKWKSLSTRKEVDLIQEIKNFLAEKPETKIYIGTDSQVKGKKTDFASAVVLHWKNNGGRVFYFTETKPNFYDRGSRLMEEVWMSIQVADMLKAEGFERSKTPEGRLCVDLDLNPDKKYFSNTVMVQAVGWVTGLGYECRVKPDAAIASHCADMLCK
jgi:predicted RNase H-related nuclease YkuK (DUF458 family)